MNLKYCLKNQPNFQKMTNPYKKKSFITKIYMTWFLYFLFNVFVTRLLEVIAPVYIRLGKQEKANIFSSFRLDLFPHISQINYSFFFQQLKDTHLKCTEIIYIDLASSCLLPPLFVFKATSCRILTSYVFFFLWCKILVDQPGHLAHCAYIDAHVTFFFVCSLLK